MCRVKRTRRNFSIVLLAEPSRKCEVNRRVNLLKSIIMRYYEYTVCAEHQFLSGNQPVTFKDNFPFVGLEREVKR